MGPALGVGVSEECPRNRHFLHLLPANLRTAQRGDRDALCAREEALARAEKPQFGGHDAREPVVVQVERVLPPRRGTPGMPTQDLPVRTL